MNTMWILFMLLFMYFKEYKSQIVGGLTATMTILVFVAFILFHIILFLVFVQSLS